ncbi:MAG: LptA/OstA family protein [Desulfomonile sp.]|nr:LptA/OstA family protein [Desulfomonile sp.]
MRFRLACIAVVLAFWAAAAVAQGLNLKNAGLGSDQPISLLSGKAVTRNVPDGIEVTFERDVKLTQGNATITCERLVIVYDERRSKTSNPNGKNSKDLPSSESIRSMVFSGNVKLVQGESVVTAGKAMYDNVKRTLTLTDRPRLSKGRDSAAADTIIFYLDENRSELLGNGSPITFTFKPPEKKKDSQ